MCAKTPRILTGNPSKSFNCVDLNEDGKAYFLRVTSSFPPDPNTPPPHPPTHPLTPPKKYLATPKRSSACRFPRWSRISRGCSRRRSCCSGEDGGCLSPSRYGAGLYQLSFRCACAAFVFLVCVNKPWKEERRAGRRR